MNIKSIKLALGVMAVSSFFANVALAVGPDNTTTPAVYKVTVKKIEVCTNAACTSPVVIAAGSMTFDIASAGIGATIGNYVANAANIPAGTYTHGRITLGRSFTLKGRSSVALPNGFFCYTNSADTSSDVDAPGLGGVNVNGAAALAAAGEQEVFVPNMTGTYAGNLTAQYAAAGLTMVDDDTMTVTGPFGAPFTIAADSPASANIRIDFDVANTIQFYAAGPGCALGFAPPEVNVYDADNPPT